MKLRILILAILMLGLSSTTLRAQPVATHTYALVDTPAEPFDLPTTLTQIETPVETPVPQSHPASDEASRENAAALAEAEALYATAVMANLDHRWFDAQVAFEQAIVILGDLEPTSEADSALVSAIGHLLGEIAADYQQTLVALGELDADASISAVLLRFSGNDETSDVVAVPIIEAPPEKIAVDYNFPVELNDKVRNCIVYYQTVARQPFERFLARSGRYLPMMKKIVASYGLPTDIAYLPLVESGFNNKAYSYAHAAGPWQFISSTGRNYGLRRTWWFDERRDFEKSTHAASRYLKDLYEMFDSWPLALAAYNGGEGRVGRQIKRQNTKNFWNLRLHRQTRNYVPLFMASLLIAKDPETYGFHGIEYDTPIEYDWVATNKALELKDVARALGCSIEAVTDLNPELRRLVTPPDIKPYRFRVPVGLGDKFAAAYPKLKQSQRTEWVRHKVRRGETLSQLAGRFGIRVSEIVRINKLRSRHRISVGQTLTIPVPLAYADNRSYSAPKKRSVRQAARGDQKYKVRRGDSLWKLAKKFGTTTSAIRRTNRMGSGSKLIAGTTITIPGRNSSSSSTRRSFWYTIRQGDTIGLIAKRFGISIRQILGANRLSNPNRIRAGQRIRIPKGL